MFRTFLPAPALAAVLVIAAGLAPSSVRADSPPAEDKIVVKVASLRSSSGSVRCSLYDNADGFPTDQKHVVARVRAVIKDKTATCTFKSPKRGQKYATVIHHDENDDGVFQRGALGMPLEGYGFSNNVRPVLSAPSFEACQFSFGGGQTSLTINARY